jgi:transposase
VHFEIKKIGGHKYKYQRFNYRVGDKIKHKNKYLGPVHPINQSQRKKGGRKPAVFVRQLSEEERQTLFKEQKNPKAVIRDRAKIILLSSERKPAKDISKNMKRDYARTLQIIKKFNEQGVDIFKIKTSSGRPSRITEEQKKDIVETSLKSPKEVSLPHNNWTCRLLHLWFEAKYKQKISDEWIREILIRNRITFTVPKHKLLKADDCLREAFKKN